MRSAHNIALDTLLVTQHQAALVKQAYIGRMLGLQGKAMLSRLGHGLTYIPYAASRIMPKSMRARPESWLEGSRLWRRKHMSRYNAGLSKATPGQRMFLTGTGMIPGFVGFGALPAIQQHLDSTESARFSGAVNAAKEFQKRTANSDFVERLKYVVNPNHFARMLNPDI